MEEKLKEYRLRKRRKEFIENAKEKLAKTKQKIVQLIIPKIFFDMDKEKKEDEVLLMEPEEFEVEHEKAEIDEPIELISEVNGIESLEDEKQESWRYFIIKWSLYILIWITLYIYFLRIEFGAVFFVISMLIGIYLNTRTRPKKLGEVSAYSVFNKNCKSIEGTLQAEQLEKQLLYGIASLR